MKFLPTVYFKTDGAQFIYAIIVIILVPAALAFNTLFTLNKIQKDIDYELNNKAILVEPVLAIANRDKLESTTVVHSIIKEVVAKYPEIKAVEVFRINNEILSPITSTSETTKAVVNPTLNQLAWAENKAFSTQIQAAVGSGNSERIWLVASPVMDTTGKKIALLNMYISASDIDKISNRTTQDSFYILIATMVLVSLLLINHFRFFEMSILFKKLSEIDKLKDDFISMASHELKNPLTAIMGYAYMLNQSKIISNDKQSKQDTWVIIQSAKRLSLLIEDILDVSRIEQKRLKIEPRVIDLRNIINQIALEFMLQAKQKGIQFNYAPPNLPVNVYVDQARVTQIFVNLISNAIKYTPKGSVTITHQVVKGAVMTSIKDTGVGISEENKSKLFAKFSRIYNDQTKSVPGTGLGLWITKQLVEKMGGKIEVESIANTGTSFNVTFPIKNSETPSSPIVDEPIKKEGFRNGS